MKIQSYYNYEGAYGVHAITLEDNESFIIRECLSEEEFKHSTYIKDNIEEIKAKILRDKPLNELRTAILEDQKLHPKHPLVAKADKERKEEAEKRDRSILRRSYSDSSDDDSSAIGTVAMGISIGAAASISTCGGTTGC